MTGRLLLLLALGVLVAVPEYATAACAVPEGKCEGCGCKGGPGYREIATGRCVGFRELDKRCGTPPAATLCTFENAPGTGANKECAMEPRPSRTKAPPAPAKPAP